MPGMDMGSGVGAAWLALAEIALFWSATVVHVLRLLAQPWLPDADPPADAGHAVMGAGMVFMAFPAAPVETASVMAVAFGALSVVFLIRALRRSLAGRRLTSLAIGLSQAAMAVMLGVSAHPGPWVTTPVACVLVVCAMVHGQRWLSACPVGADRGRTAVLVTLPHLGVVCTTLAMAAMFAVA